jgi:hypothetical protein
MNEAGEGAPYVLAALMPQALDFDSVTHERLRNLAAKLGKVSKTAVKAMVADKVRQATPTDRADTERERIEITPRHINRATRRCAELLRDRIYLIGHVPMALTRTSELPKSDDEGVVLGGVQHARDSWLFVTPVPGMVKFQLDEMVDFFKFVAREREWRQTPCPAEVIEKLIDAASLLDYRQCSGIIGVPLFEGGDIVAQPGYHPPSGKIIAFDGTMPAIPARPTKADAEAALEVLLRPFRGYLSGDDNAQLRAGLAAAALTAVARPSLPTAPALVLDANTPGAGKGKLARALAVLTSGTLPAIITEGHGEEETEKRIASAILSGCQAILLDNLQRTLASSTLESILTEGVATIRQFGKLGADITMPFAGWSSSPRTTPRCERTCCAGCCRSGSWSTRTRRRSGNSTSIPTRRQNATGCRSWRQDSRSCGHGGTPARPKRASKSGGPSSAVSSDGRISSLAL